jgi:endonuclease III
MRQAVRSYSNREVAILDQIAWNLSKTVCLATLPQCSECPLLSSCPKVGVH